MITLKNYITSHFAEIFVLEICVLSFFLRLENLIIPYNAGDKARDFLVASHIFQFHDFPISLALFGSIPSSPLMYYIISPFLIFSNSITTLGFLNIAIQSVSIFLVFLITKTCDRPVSGVVASVLFAFSQINFDQSIHGLWAPWIMQFFLLLSFLFLAYFFTYKKIIYGVFSVVFIAISFSIHYSVIGILPLLIFTFIRLSSRKQSLIFGGIFLSLIILFHIGSFMTYTNHPIYMKLGNDQPLNSSFSLLNFIKSTSSFLNNYFFFESKSFYSLQVVTSFFCVGTILIFLFLEKNVYRKNIVAYGVLLIIFQLVMYSFINVHRNYFTYISPAIFSTSRYFTPVFAIFFIILSISLTPSYFSAKRVYVLIPISLFLIYILCPIFPALKYRDVSYQSVFPKIANEIYKDSPTSNFTIKLEDTTLSAQVWSSLEQKFERQFVQLNPMNYQGYTVPNMYTHTIYYICQHACIFPLHASKAYRYDKSLSNSSGFMIKKYIAQL